MNLLLKRIDCRNALPAQNPKPSTRFDCACVVQACNMPELATAFRIDRQTSCKHRICSPENPAQFIVVEPKAPKGIVHRLSALPTNAMQPNAPKRPISGPLESSPAKSYKTSPEADESDPEPSQKCRTRRPDCCFDILPIYSWKI